MNHPSSSPPAGVGYIRTKSCESRDIALPLAIGTTALGQRWSRPLRWVPALLLVLFGPTLGCTRAPALAVGPSAAPVGSAPAAKPADPTSARALASEAFQRGVVVSCPTWGPIWGTPAMATALAEIAALGANWVSIHPYARIERDGTVQSAAAASLPFLAQATRYVDARGLALFWTPHLAHWGRFAWRGAIRFDDEAAWSRFFATYKDFIVDQAAHAATLGVPLFGVGNELDGTAHRPEWRQVVAAVRAVFPGKLTYAANWDAVATIPFWDALDFVGVQGYFPLAVDVQASADAIRAAWQPHRAQLAALAARTGKRILFTEVGYARGKEAATQPWEAFVEDGDDVIRHRQHLLAAALDLEGEPWLAGMYFWKWIPGDDRGQRDFSMRDPEAKEALRAAWTGGSSLSGSNSVP